MSKPMPNPPNKSAGFTLVELIVVMVLTILFSGLIMTFFLDLWSSTATLENDSETLVTRQNVGDALREALNATSGLINQNSIADANVTNPDPADNSGTHWLILHAIPNNTAMPTSGNTPLMYYASPSVDISKNFILNGTQPYQDEFVLYLNGNTKQLLLRTLANPGASGNRIRTSCPPAQATASCPADRLLADSISSVGKRYFSRSGNLLDWTSITDTTTGSYIGPDFPSVEVLELTLNLYRKSTLHAGSDTNNKTIIRVAFRNG
jgi:prepilin-type N-terminal cleavage/methylation domain-containing protein